MEDAADTEDLKDPIEDILIEGKNDNGLLIAIIQETTLSASLQQNCSFLDASG